MHPILLTLVYVAPLHLLPPCRPNPPHTTRSTPRVLLWRQSTVLLSTVGLTLASGLTARQLGVDNVRGLGAAVGVTGSLWAGNAWLYWRVMKDWNRLRPEWEGWTAWRDYVVGPGTEELVFRSVLLSSFYASAAATSASWTWICFTSPLCFGLAHVHHGYEVYQTIIRQRNASSPDEVARIRSAALRVAVSQSLFQLAYTTAFGAFSTLLFLRYQSFWTCFAVHSVCNWLGIPPIGWGVQAFPERKNGILAAYAAGIVAFGVGVRQIATGRW